MIDEIRVTQEHIDNGIPQDVDSCPIAQSIGGHYDQECNVDGATIEIYCDNLDDGDDMVFTASSGLHEWIGKFDSGEYPVEPITLCLHHTMMLAYIKGEVT